MKLVCDFYLFFFLIEEDGGLPTIVVDKVVVVLDNYSIVQFQPAEYAGGPGKSTW